MTLDTVHLKLTDYTIEPDTVLEIHPSAYVVGTGEKNQSFHFTGTQRGRIRAFAKLNVPTSFN